MEKYFGEKQERFSFRKLSVGLVSATISSLFFMSVLASSSVDAQETAGVHYKYVADSELSSEEKKQLVYDIPTYVENDDETYYLVYKLNSQNQLAELPNTGSKNERQALVAGASLAALGILIFAVSKKKVKNKTVLHLVLVAGIGNGVLVSVHALENHLLLNYNTDYELTSGEKLPLPKEISGYTYIGYIKEGKTTSESEVSNQKSSVATPTKQQKVDYNVTPNFVDHPSTVQAIQEQTPVSSTKPTEVQVVEKPFSTELINPRKEEKQSSDSQEQLAEHKNLETKKEEKISPKEKTGVNTLNPQDEVLSGQLNKPELLYREETIETKIDFQEEIQENPDLAEGTVRVKQEGKLGKKVEIVRIFSVNKEEVSREIVSTSTTAPIPRIVEKGTKKTQVIKEQPETGVEHKDVQSGAIVEPAIQPELPEAVVTDKGEPAVQPELPEAVVSDKGEPEVQPELPEAVVSEKGEPEVQPALPEAVVSDKGVPEVQPVLPEATSENTPAPSKPETPASTEAAANGAEGKETEEVVTPAPVTDNSPSDTGDTPAPETLTNTEESGKQSVETSHSGAESATEVTGEASETTSGDEGKEEKEANEQSGDSTEPSTVSEGGSPATQPAGEEDKSELTSETSTTPPVDATNDSGNSESSPSVIEGNKEETNSQNTEASTEKGNSESSNSDSEKPQGDEPTVQVGSEPTASTEGTSTGKEDSAPKAEEKQVDKKLELRNISNVELFTVENNKYRHVTSFDAVPNDPSNYFMKVKSENFKDVMLPVKSIESVRKDNQDVYKIVGQANDLIQHENNSTLENYTYYLPKVIKRENGVYTSFKNLVEAMNSNPSGEFRLGATMDAREVELQDGQESYIEKEFSGRLIGENKGKYYAIHNLKKPLFKALSHATIQDLSIKEVNVSSKEDAATIAKVAKNETTITNVHSSGVIAGEHSIGGLVSQVTDSKILNSSYTGRITNTYDTKSTYQIGGLVGKLSGDNALIEKSISSIDMATNANQGDQTVGGIAGIVDRSARISNSYVEGNLNNVKHFGKVGGVVGNLWDAISGEEKSGQLSNVLSDVNVTNGNAIAGYDFTGIKATNTYSNKNNKVVSVVQVDDELVTKDSEKQRGTVLEADKVNAKKVELVSKHSTKVEDFDFTSRYTTSYKEVTDYQQSREQVYKNIEKLLPFYNRETIIKYGNLVENNSDLFTEKLLSVVPMKNNEVITDINKNKREINKLLLHFEGNKSQVLNITYKDDFSKVAEYNIEGQGLLYTPNTLLHSYDDIVNAVLNDLKSVQYSSAGVRKVLDISGDIKLTELYLDEQFEKTKANIEDSLSKLLSADAAVAENNNKIIDNYVIEKIKNNKEALLLGLTYLERWYNFKYDNASAKDLVLYHLDFFGKSNSSALDNVIELGRSGFNNLLAKNNVITYNVLLSKNYGTETLFKVLEGYRKVFLPKTSNNEWFKKQTKAYIVEEKSTIEEVREKQGKEGTKYSIGVYDRLTSPSWKYQSMVLPLLTLPEKSVFMIANISTIGFGAYDRYRSSEYPKGEKLNKFVEDNAKEAAKRFRDHYDYWYKILDNDNKEKLYRSILVYDAFKFGTDKDKDKVTHQATFETNHPAIKHFFGPAGNNVVHNGHGAYATGDAFYYMAYRMLDKDGAVTYTHEMTHNSDREIYLGGYGRRSGLGPEFYAKGLLQAPDHPDDPTITINSVLKYDEAENANRLQVKDPTQRFNNAEDLRKYMHNLFDLVYTLEKLEGEAVVNLDTNEKGELLRKIENEYKPDPDGNEVYATNVVRRLNLDELNKLTSFNSLIENDIITRRKYINEGEYKRNGYYTINLFSPIYSALSSDKGTPGDLMGRRMAFELLAAKGYKEGMVPYISNQYEKEAKANGSKINSYGKEIGLVTDKLVLKKVFNDEYSSWVEFKKAMYKERENKFNKLSRISFVNPNNWGRQETITIDNIDKLRSIIREAVKKDAEDYRAQEYPDTNSRVYKLKKAIFKAYLDQTNEFRSSIFENKK
ncbi:ZmpA/ZmpB/ZmpC family metallo-endopeptidase [Streptococcus pneumoniae]|uniref:zinc metalloprotease A n=1 Tax=Streptococcus pneumoniae TaxID=1313 RepID=UPI000768D3F6|nr:ZmpA/ZmpB/ZmpC family metallo-endopeptidase [Streptococcus pneumoniae]MDS4451553.1 ZmpA/ZmpB/ZmpC family metallo-endopeptidase [Streptococcus pneumoniae]MDS4590499.1 ZmpA/ZmpB/ZmpC family metallo-endopeptidase [Streptococcus pneumoniae]MDS4635782.1 ZmpA/ZmpB/ZmpC family metallo-endopeptidase [Streptococcus pneumoniae]MDT5581275.1 ZmpA/ZmpB/ZmpC family metallo-endopeptidase [Streptococcus pneumoniae]MDT5786736.1 ZmpA/ZmpB/ZmpC family metallo-endopeptidase [Streptococcus pneumoniae]